MFAVSIRIHEEPTKPDEIIEWMHFSSSILLLRYRETQYSYHRPRNVSKQSKKTTRLMCWWLQDCFHAPRKSPLCSLAKLTYSKQEQHPCRWAIYIYRKSFIQKIWEDAKNQFKDNTPNIFLSTLTNAVVVNYDGFSMNLLFMKYRFAYILSRLKTSCYTLPPTNQIEVWRGIYIHVWKERANTSTC